MNTDDTDPEKDRVIGTRELFIILRIQESGQEKGMKAYRIASSVVVVALLSVSGFGFQGTGAQPTVQKASPKASNQATAPIQTFVGVISDGQCAPKGGHKEVMQKARVNTDANCVKGCSRRYGYVLYVPATKKIYKLSDQERPAELAGKRVKIKGALNPQTQTIFVSSIEPAL